MATHGAGLLTYAEKTRATSAPTSADSNTNTTNRTTVATQKMERQMTEKKEKWHEFKVTFYMDVRANGKEEAGDLAWSKVVAMRDAGFEMDDIQVEHERSRA